MGPLSDDAIVVRAGMERDAKGMLEGLRERVDSLGEPPKLSVFATEIQPGEAMPDTLRRLCTEARARWGKVQVATARSLRTAGFTILDERNSREGPSHYHVDLGWPVSESVLDDFIGCFDEPIPSPLSTTERKAL